MMSWPPKTKLSVFPQIQGRSLEEDTDTAQLLVDQPKHVVIPVEEESEPKAEVRKDSDGDDEQGKREDEVSDSGDGMKLYLTYSTCITPYGILFILVFF